MSREREIIMQMFDLMSELRKVTKETSPQYDELWGDTLANVGSAIILLSSIERMVRNGKTS